MTDGLFKRIWIFIRTIPYWKLSCDDGYSLFLDDQRIPEDAFKFDWDFSYLQMNWIVVRNYDQFTRHIEKQFRHGKFPKTISYDHDLGLEHIQYYFDNGGHENPPDPAEAIFTEKTGMDCAKWLVNFCMDHNLKLPGFKVHSKNVCGKDNILGILSNFKKHQENG